MALSNITIATFWDRYPKIYILKTTVQILLEFAFLCNSIYIIVIEYKMLDTTCGEKVFGPWVLRAIVAELGLIHLVNIVRNCLKLWLRLRKGSKQVKAGVVKCILIDCYCCLASTGWAFAQVSFFLKKM